MLTGVFRDRLSAADGCLLADSGWRPNTIALGAWPLVAGLMRNHPGLRGLQFCAVGEGRPAWDGAAPPADPTAGTLAREVDRTALAPESLTYIDGFGHPTATPTSRLEATAVFSWTLPRVLREFGLFGGDATPAPNSGYLINYVVHPAITVDAGATLTRRVRLSFRPAAVGAMAVSHDLPAHPLGNLPATALEGVGPQIGSALDRAGASTIRGVAELGSAAAVRRVSLTQLVELRARARLALWTAARLPPLTALDDQEIQTLLATAPPALAAESGAPVASIETLQERLGLLQLALDARTLRRMTLGELRTGAH